MRKFLLCCALILSFTANAGNYTFDDLKILAEQKNFKEFLDHAHDIRPTERNKEWRQFLADMANEYLIWATKNERFELSFYKKIESMSEWPSLKNDAFYQQRREAYGLKFFQRCTTSESFNCQQEIKRFWSKSSKSPEFSYNMALLFSAGEKSTDTENLAPFIYSLTKTSVSKFYCDKEIVQRTFISSMENLRQGNSTKEALSKKVDELINDDCWSEIRKVLVPLMKGDNREIASLSHALLKAKDSLDQEQNDLFLVRYLIEWPVTGDTFNEAWNVISKLGEDYDRRQTLLKNIKTLDPLPGKLFALADSEKRSVILSHMVKNIPEYADLYARTCVNYLQGKGEFPHGNPTVECPELFQASSDNNWVEQGLKLKYSSIKKEFSK